MGILPDCTTFIVDGSWDFRIIAISSLIFLFTICLIGVEWVVKFDFFQLGLLICGLFMFFIGTFTTDASENLGFTGYNTKTFSSNWSFNFQSGENLISVLVYFFPLVC